MPKDDFANADLQLSDPWSDAAEVTFTAGAWVATHVTRGLYIGTGGDVTVVMAGGGTITYANVPSGYVLSARVLQVLESGTDASDLVALW